MLNLDTHIVIDFVRGSLSARERDVMRGSELAISSVVLWEIAKLNQLGRIALDLADPRFQAFVAQLRVFPIDVQVASTSCSLDFKSDPADEIIAATSIVHELPLVTTDKRICASKLVPLA
jgi:PIN domain nuclease of toxin-antitoxin system